MQGHHLPPHPLHQQQLQHQLAALLSSALSQPGSSSVDADSGSDQTEKGGDSERILAIDSLQRAILYPPNALVVAHSATFLSQGLARLLSDRSSPVRRSAAVTYGSLAAVCCAFAISSNGGITDVFVAWALPLVRRFGTQNGPIELAFLGLQQFLDAGVTNGAGRYVLQILKSFQDVLEDERTPFGILCRVLGLLTLIASKYEQYFQPHFVDIIDLLLGWALVPDLSEMDRKMLTDSFLQFKNHWIRNLHFSISLLLKFLGDMEVLVHDNANLENSQLSGRLIALFCCFSAVIRATASAALEDNLNTHICRPLEAMVPRLLDCLLVIGKKLGWVRWTAESWQCIVLLAEVLMEKFSTYYPVAVDILFQSSEELQSFQLQKLLRDNRRVLSLQKFGLLPSSIHKMLEFDLPFSNLRLHPSRSVVGLVASTYMFIIKHECIGVANQAVSLLTEELRLLKKMLILLDDETTSYRNVQTKDLSSDDRLSLCSKRCYTKNELIYLIKFDLGMIMSCFCLDEEDYMLGETNAVASRSERSTKLVFFLQENLDPLQSPIQDILELQVLVSKVFRRLGEVELRSRFTSRRSYETLRNEIITVSLHTKETHLPVFADHLKRHETHIIQLLSDSSPLAAKLEGIEFLFSFCGIASKIYDQTCPLKFCESCEYVCLGRRLLCSVLKCASDREVKVRLGIASVLGACLQARLISPESLCHVVEVSLDRLGDHDISVKNSYVRLLSIIIPVTAYSHGIFGSIHGLCEGGCLLNWKHLFALMKSPYQLRSPQLMGVLSYISPRSKVSLSSWIQRLPLSCRNLNALSLNHQDEKGNIDGVLQYREPEDDVLSRISPVNNIATLWWSIHEAARHCVGLRLRTNFGGPAQTFAALERMLLDVSQVLLLENEHKQSDSNTGFSRIHLLPMRLLLNFVESFKKNVYNAYEGSYILPCPSRQSSLFFRANKKVCEEWFSRICEPMLNASLALHCNEATFHYSTSRLVDTQNLISSFSRDSHPDNLNISSGKLAGDVMKALRDASLALCRSHEPEFLSGLHNWAVLTLSPFFGGGHNDSSLLFSWMMGLVYQAYGEYEKATAHFSLLLQSEASLSSMGAEGIQFAIARIIEGYTAVSDWKSLELWLLELQRLRSMHAGKTYSGALTTAGIDMNAILALARFDDGDVQGSRGYLDLTPKTCNELSLDLRIGLERSEQTLLRAMLLTGQKDEMLKELKKSELMLNEGFSIICLGGLNEAVPYAMQLHCILALKAIFKLDSEDHSEYSDNLNTLSHALQFPFCKSLQDCSPWLKVLRVYRTQMPSSPLALLLCKRLMGLARKQRNFLLAGRMAQYLNDHVSFCWREANLNLFSDELTYEKVLLKYSMGKHEEAVLNLWMFVLPEMMSTESVISSSAGKTLKAKALLKLYAWLKRGNLIQNIENVIYKMQDDLQNASSVESLVSTVDDNIRISDVNWTVFLEEIAGMAVKLSSIICPDMCKTWFEYASWCYNQARASLCSKGTVLQCCTLSSVLVPEVLPDRFTLTEEETLKVETVLRNFLHRRKYTMNSGSLDEEELGNQHHPAGETLVKSLTQQAAYLIQMAAGEPGTEDVDGKSLSEAVSFQLEMLLRSTHYDSENDIPMYAADLVDVWRSLRRRRVSLFGLAAHGYVQYLSYSSSRVSETLNDQSDFICANEKLWSRTIQATLNIFQIILNYGVELKETLERSLPKAPLSPWQEIIPQLFARLTSHPLEEVRKQLEGLLMMLAKHYPWSIVYPALVDANVSDDKTSEELSRVLAYLTGLYPKLIQDVQLLINELGSITVLWEDQWLNTLQELHPDAMKRINTLKEEAVRIEENAALSYIEKKKINAAKYSAMMAPVVVALERRLTSTSRDPETPHEIWFQKEYGKLLKLAILSLKKPPSSSLYLGNVWKPFDSIAASLLAYQRKPLVSLSDIAPRLLLLRSSDAPMPGLDINCLVTVSSFFDNLVILSTKTRPKKLILLGSDGRQRTYLLKGGEDLRLDARIMQLLRVVDRFLHSYSHTGGRSLAVRYYSVTPISDWAGLIQWVDHVVSIYSVYKSWQTRVQFSQLSSVGVGNLKSPAPSVPRPSDMFYGKIIPALKEKGLRKVVSRKDWPHDVKRKVLLDLMKETPRQLLYQELWCASEGFKYFFARSKRFSGTVSVMSMLGYILGLGDRHLDNMLVDFSSGDVVHIDYNVCFDKGRRLKIPEIVPFRLTPTIEAALGFTGKEGIFKANCEVVLNILRNNKDILLLLLETFVWDPLIEWTRGEGHDEAVIGGEEKRGIELAVSLSLFASRFQEIRVPLQEHHELMLSSLPASASALEKFLDVLNRYEIVSSIFYQIDQERSTLLQREISAKTFMSEATSMAEKVRLSYEMQAQDFTQAKAAVMGKAQETARWLEHHGKVLDALRSGYLDELKPLIKPIESEESLSIIASVSAAGVPLPIVPEPAQDQCYDLDREVSRIMSELCDSLLVAFGTLQDYAMALQRVLPLNYITTSPVHAWAQILQQSVTKLTPDGLNLSKQESSILLAKAPDEIPDSLKQRHRELGLKLDEFVLEIEKIRTECSRLVSSADSYAEGRSKDRLLTALVKYMRSLGYCRSDIFGDSTLQGDPGEKEMKVLAVLRLSMNELLKKLWNKISDVLGGTSGEQCLQHSSKNVLRELEEQVEMCDLLFGFADEVQRMVHVEMSDFNKTMDTKWTSVFRSCINSGKVMIDQMLSVALPEVIMSVISYNAEEVMEYFGSLSQIRGSVDAALQQLIEIEKERASLVELEENYFVKVGQLTQQKIALEEASSKDKDNLSWEEAEEWASQEDSCRAQLDQLHNRWNQRHTQSTGLRKRKANLLSSLASSERQFLSLVRKEGDLHNEKSGALFALLVKTFSDLECIDQVFSSYDVGPRYSSMNVAHLLDSSDSEESVSIWKLANLLESHSFFVWKIHLLDSFLDSCLGDITSLVEKNMGFDQIYNCTKGKTSVLLQGQFNLYLRERVAPALLLHIEKEGEILHPLSQSIKEMDSRDHQAVQEMQQLLENYWNACERDRATKSAISLMKYQDAELTESLQRVVLEMIQIEWLYDQSLSPRSNVRELTQDIVSSDKLSSSILNLGRQKLLEKIQTYLSAISASMEQLKATERMSVQTETQLERAMSWACAGPGAGNSGSLSSKNSGIPPEFHNHLLRRRQLLSAVQELASSVTSICTSVLAFEASREGFIRISEDDCTMLGDSKTWQKTSLNSLIRLESSFLSFTRVEKEWKLAQGNLEGATNNLQLVASDLSTASARRNAASDDLQSTLSALRDSVLEASTALSAFSNASKLHNALTVECGNLLEEVLAITGVHDIHRLGKEAVTLHAAFLSDISEVSSTLHPLEESLSNDAAALSDGARYKERETVLEITPVQGQALYRFYCSTLRDSCKLLRSLVPSITYSMKELLAMMTKLAKTASDHAGNLHKAFVGLGESQVLRSHDFSLSPEEFNEALTMGENRGLSSVGNDGKFEDLNSGNDYISQEDAWLSPPDSIDSSSPSSDSTSDRIDESDLINCLSWGYGSGTQASSTKDLDQSDILQTLNLSEQNEPFQKEAFECENEGLNPTKAHVRGSRLIRGKNLYAVTVLEQVERKLNGREPDEKRCMGVAEQVEYLLKEATSVDNLCNMYEGWTPWI
ncbi:uncharacterized protein LOC144702411 [Wolffia australiana]